MFYLAIVFLATLSCYHASADSTDAIVASMFEEILALKDQICSLQTQVDELQTQVDESCSSCSSDESGMYILCIPTHDR